jgi:hypothetical protein
MSAKAWTTMRKLLVIAGSVGAAPPSAAQPVAADALSGARLNADVERYAGFGEHRLGTEADRRTT